MIASVATYPHEVLRTRLQVHKSDKSTPSLKSIPPIPHTGKGVPHFYSPLVTGSHPPPPAHLASSSAGTGASAWQPARHAAESAWRRKGGIVATFLEIKRQDGWKGFYRGLSINLVRTVPNSAVTMLT